jgi:hypothetical protein
MNLSVVSETATTLTLGWSPPAGVGSYTFYAAGDVVSVASRNMKDGSPRSSVKFHKTTPGPPFQVAAICRSSAGAFSVDAGFYSPPLPALHPSSSLYPSETRP